MTKTATSAQRVKPVPVVLAAPDGREARGDVDTIELTSRQRAGRAAVAVLICWALAAASILIPVAHFALVPGLLLAGPIAGWFRYRQRRFVRGGEATCPACDETIGVKPQAEDWPLTTPCERCGEELVARPR